MDKLRVGVIGLGMGRHHITSYQNHPSVQVVAISDTDPARLQEIGINIISTSVIPLLIKCCKTKS